MLPTPSSSLIGPWRTTEDNNVAIVSSPSHLVSNSNEGTCILIILNMPSDYQVGIDLYTIKTSETFMGFCRLKEGVLHSFYYENPVTNSDRNGIYFRFNKAFDVIIKVFDEGEERLYSSTTCQQYENVTASDKDQFEDSFSNHMKRTSSTSLLSREKANFAFIEGKIYSLINKPNSNPNINKLKENCELLDKAGLLYEIQNSKTENYSSTASITPDREKIMTKKSKISLSGLTESQEEEFLSRLRQGEFHTSLMNYEAIAVHVNKQIVKKRKEKESAEGTFLSWDSLTNFVSDLVIEKANLFFGEIIEPVSESIDFDHIMKDSNLASEYENTSDSNLISSSTTTVSSHKRENSNMIISFVPDIYGPMRPDLVAIKKHEEGQKNGIIPNNIPPPKRWTGAEITQYSMDKTARFTTILLEYFNNDVDLFLGEFQLCFINFLTFFCLKSFEAWKDRIRLLSSCVNLAIEKPIFYSNMLNILRQQLLVIPHDFFQDELFSLSSSVDSENERLHSYHQHEDVNFIVYAVKEIMEILHHLRFHPNLMKRVYDTGFELCTLMENFFFYDDHNENEGKKKFREKEKICSKNFPRDDIEGKEKEEHHNNDDDHDDHDENNTNREEELMPIEVYNDLDSSSSKTPNRFQERLTHEQKKRNSFKNRLLFPEERENQLQLRPLRTVEEWNMETDDDEDAFEISDNSWYNFDEDYSDEMSVVDQNQGFAQDKDTTWNKQRNIRFEVEDTALSKEHHMIKEFQKSNNRVTEETKCLVDDRREGVSTEFRTDDSSSVEIKKMIMNGEEIELYRRPKVLVGTSFGGYMQKLLSLRPYFQAQYPNLFASMRPGEEDILMTVERIIDEYERKKETYDMDAIHCKRDTINYEAVAYNEATEFLLNEIGIESSLWWNTLKK